MFGNMNLVLAVCALALSGPAFGLDVTDQGHCDSLYSQSSFEVKTVTPFASCLND